jgi:predicted ATPase/DNA-binding winged helix-turn-helix (wHTH) protein
MQLVSSGSGECYSFASFRLYPKQRTLLHDSTFVTIGGRAFDVLVQLVTRAGIVISLTDLMHNVWPTVHVEEANLRVQMAMLRKLLSHCEEAKRAIETIPLRGYCFILPVHHHPHGDVIDQEIGAATSTLPMLFNPIIGREEVIETIAAALDERRLVTITGPGGIGKTTVAIATARRSLGIFRHGMTFVDLSHAEGEGGALQFIAEALGLDNGRDLPTALCDHLRDRDQLLILDTCEHIVEPLAGLVEMLLKHCTQIRILVTSREALRATGEWTHRLSSLTFPSEGEAIDETNWASFSAIALFVERAQSLTRYEVEHRDLPVLAELCRRLDGIALALELAAARVADLGLHEIARHLDDRFTILTRGRRTALPRHQTLLAAIDWSYSLLSEDEQHVLQRIATLGDSFSVEQAITSGLAVCSSRAAELLCGLYDKSLLSIDLRDGTPVYRLSDSTKAYVSGINVS